MPPPPRRGLIVPAVLFLGFLGATAQAEPEHAAPATTSTSTAPLDKTRFIADPVTDGAVLGVSLGFGVLSQAVISTGELGAQQPGDSGRLSSFDRVAVTESVDPHASTFSSIGVAVAGAYALGDTIYTGLSDGTDAALADAVLYSESASITFASANLVKIAVRRPRPRAYRERDRLAALGQPYPANPGTDSSLSFFSGHASQVAALSATATYLAFSRSHGTTRGFITLLAGTLLTSFVGYERVRAAAHFPTDVIAGAVVGAGIGTLVPALHREAAARKTAVWIGVVRPGPDGGGLALTGLF